MQEYVRPDEHHPTARLLPRNRPINEADGLVVRTAALRKPWYKRIWPYCESALVSAGMLSSRYLLSGRKEWVTKVMNVSAVSLVGFIRWVNQRFGLADLKSAKKLERDTVIHPNQDWLFLGELTWMLHYGLSTYIYGHWKDPEEELGNTGLTLDGIFILLLILPEIAQLFRVHNLQTQLENAQKDRAMEDPVVEVAPLRDAMLPDELAAFELKRQAEQTVRAQKTMLADFQQEIGELKSKLDVSEANVINLKEENFTLLKRLALLEGQSEEAFSEESPADMGGFEDVLKRRANLPSQGALENREIGEDGETLNELSGEEPQLHDDVDKGV